MVAFTGAPIPACMREFRHAPAQPWRFEAMPRDEIAEHRRAHFRRQAIERTQLAGDEIVRECDALRRRDGNRFAHGRLERRAQLGVAANATERLAGKAGEPG